MTTRQVAVMSNNISLASGAPGRVIAGIEKELFTGIVQNTGTASINVTLETPGGVSDPVTVPQGGIIRFRNVQLLSVRVSAAAIIGILGLLTLYDTVEEWLRALQLSEVDVAGLFTGLTSPIARAAYYDRNLVQATINVDTLAAAPHAVTTRATYTVPAGKKAFVTSMHIEISRETAATTLGRTRNFVGGGFGAAGTITLFDNAVGAKVVGDPSGGQVGLAGTILNVQDEDLSVAGTVSFSQQVGIMEFDA